MYYIMPKILTKTKVIRISQIQFDTLKKTESYNIDISNFIRQAIKEKIKQEYSELIPKVKFKMPF